MSATDRLAGALLACVTFRYLPPIAPTFTPLERSAEHSIAWHSGAWRCRGQLIRPSWDAYDFHNSTVLLKDGKGRGGVIRDHLLPLTSFALEMLALLREINGAESGPFVTRAGKRLHPSTVSHVVRDVWALLAAEDAAKGKEKIIKEFTFKDIRRTCETLLASLGVSRDLRSYVLSHGRSGVQSKHYDRWSYLEEKRRVLKKWGRYMRRVIAGRDPKQKEPEQQAA